VVVVVVVLLLLLLLLSRGVALVEPATHDALDEAWRRSAASGCRTSATHSPDLGSAVVEGTWVLKPLAARG